MILNCFLRYLNSSLIQAIAWHCYYNYSFFMWLLSGYYSCRPITRFLWVICWLFFDNIDSLFLDQYTRLIWYHSLRRDEYLSLKNKLFDRFSAWNLSNSSKIQHCTRIQGLPLNTPSKELVDQDCLIDYAGCDEVLKCAGCLTLHFPFCCDF